jgi:PemK-like, MazF-like toxin of type II toxin-antitoxin system
MTNPLKRGEVWLADLNPTQGSEQAGIRPIIIFQSHEFENKKYESSSHLGSIDSNDRINMASPNE